MKAMELNLVAKQVAGKHIRQNASMVEGITKIAKDRGLNDEQIKRLVEESNKEAFMQGFEKDGSQIFDVASFDAIKEAMAEKMEKKASIEISSVEYSDARYREMLGDWKPAPLEKTAEATISEEQQVVVDTLLKLASDYGITEKAIQNLSSLGYKRYNNSDTDYLIKTAAVHKDEDFKDLGDLLKIASDLEKKYNYIFEKYAGADWAAAKLVGGAISGTANMLGSAGAAVAGPALNYAVKNPGKALTGALIVPMASKSINDHPSTQRLKNTKYTGPAGAEINAMQKSAGMMEGLQHTLDLVAGAAAGFGPLSGLLGAAAKKLGGGVALTMNQREFDRSFNTIMSRNPDLQDRKGQIREYFDVLTRHSPTIAKDPIVAENMVKSFDAFGGVDFNTIKSMNEMESKNKQGNKDSISPLRF